MINKIEREIVSVVKEMSIRNHIIADINKFKTRH